MDVGIGIGIGGGLAGGFRYWTCYLKVSYFVTIGSSLSRPVVSKV